jgi:cytochrome c556
MVRISFVVASLLIEAVVIGCSPSEPARQQAVDVTPATSTTPAAMSPLAHGVQDSRLRVVMGQLSARSAQSAPPKDFPQDPEESINRSVEGYFGQAQTLAAELASTASLIPKSANVSKMGDADRAGFEAEAATLRDQALHLRDAAAGHRVEQMLRLYDSINSTCISCHSRYRDFSGQIALPNSVRRGA